ncbi:Wadjet anti-phage system protein JetD domain-containing protein [Paenibacillus sp.]|uniref:Wadjet anti-phage system protein JetD domain-containing protein n=1 Tax=Paenibacillus sp. TaxID=58172 RepID=UPI002811E431|nr:Wadjet anti-phage system protein JetD domain-containing protein [Paenibacillus sp.]
MNERYRHQLIAALLDKYERSSYFSERKRPSRRIMLKLYDGGQTDFPQYDIEQFEKRTRINNAVLSLNEEQLVSYQWMLGEENHIIAKVWLNIENLSAAYALIERKPKGDEIDDVCLELLDAMEIVQNDWAKQFLADAYETISIRRSIGIRLPADKKERTDLIRAICFIEQLGEVEILERVFSIQCFGDSKRFEKTVKTRLLGILSKYLDSVDESEDGLLRQIGISKYPEQMEFCGHVIIIFGNEAVDFSPLTFGITVSTTDFERGHLKVSPEIKSVITIENRANYIEYIYKQKSEHELVVFHGGQFSPAKRKFLQRIANTIPDTCNWYHWSDIDYGGFSILARLRREVKENVIPYRMNKSELIKYSSLTASVMPKYLEKLDSLKLRKELEDCQDCISYMIEKRIKLEQEAMLTDQRLY